MTRPVLDGPRAIREGIADYHAEKGRMSATERASEAADYLNGQINDILAVNEELWREAEALGVDPEYAADLIDAALSEVYFTSSHGSIATPYGEVNPPGQCPGAVDDLRLALVVSAHGELSNKDAGHAFYTGPRPVVDFAEVARMTGHSDTEFQLFMEIYTSYPKRSFDEVLSPQQLALMALVAHSSGVVAYADVLADDIQGLRDGKIVLTK